MILKTLLCLLLIGIIYCSTIDSRHCDSKDPLCMLKELFKLDREICNSVDKVLKLIFKKGKLKKIQPNGVKNVHFAGSITEGATIARLFSSSDEFKSGINQEVEVDLEYILLQVRAIF